MNSKNLKSKQSGFFSVGLSLIVLAIAGGTTLATKDEVEKVAVTPPQEPVEIVSNVTTTYAGIPD